MKKMMFILFVLISSCLNPVELEDELNINGIWIGTVADGSLVITTELFLEEQNSEVTGSFRLFNNDGLVIVEELTGKWIFPNLSISIGSGRYHIGSLNGKIYENTYAATFRIDDIITHIIFHKRIT